MATRRLKQGLIITGVVAVFILVPFIFWLVTIATTVRTGIEFIVVPDDITVTIEGKQHIVDYEQKLAIEPGTYSISFEAQGFETQQQDVTITEGSITQVHIALNPLTEAARNNISGSVMQSRLERIGGYNAGKGSLEIEQTYPFVNELPIVDKYFTVNSCLLDDGTVGICIKLAIVSDFYKKKALQSIKDKGIDTSTVTIQYI